MYAPKSDDNPYRVEADMKTTEERHETRALVSVLGAQPHSDQWPMD
jgi:hypothetical protein